MSFRCLWTLSLLALASCAFTNVTLRPPVLPPEMKVSGGNRRTVQVVVPFLNERPTHRCGIQKNGLNMATATVHCSSEPAWWLAELLARELRTAGFDVATSTPSSPNAVRLEGHLLQFFLEPVVGAFTFSPEADIHVRLVASSLSGLLAERDFYVKSIETSVFGSESNFQLASDGAAREIVANMVSAVLDLMDRYRDLGTVQATIPST